jgi:hypothetical protein
MGLKLAFLTFLPKKNMRGARLHAVPTVMPPKTGVATKVKDAVLPR